MFSNYDRWIHCLNNRPPDDDWIEWLIDFTSYEPVFFSIFGLMYGAGVASIIYQTWCVRKEWIRD
ncbi:MAG: hypothetical protein QF793_01170 [Candidatus Peribacteraceae bacterium]|jgi:uncharacterized membrane protein YeiB|nr:hypothetical protein [bacterium]MDP6561514.1 hypothetical protein [Candidatus Peribacteraceae bacterium]